MKAAVIVFPGSNCDRDLAVALRGAGAEVTLVWHKDTDLPPGLDLVGVPGGFSFGDYLRCGAIAARSPVMRAAAEVVAEGEAAGDRDEVEARGQRGLLVPDHRDLRPGGGERRREVAIAVGAGEDDDGGFHLRASLSARSR